MRIGVELRNIIEGECGGLVPLLQGVLDTLFAKWPEHEVELFCTPANRRLFASVPPQVRVHEFPIDFYYTLLDVHAAVLNLDVLLCSYPFSHNLSFPACRQIVLIPDIQHEFFPEFFTPDTLQGRRDDFARVLREAGAVATISEHARQTLRDQPGARCEDIFLMSPALRTEKGQEQGSLTPEELALLPKHDFFLFPANLWPHKNHRRLLEAFVRFLERKKNRSFELVLTGHPKGWVELAKDFPNLPVRHLGFVSRGLLQTLMARAKALVFFSLFEGFGMPLLEAFHAGTPVLCSNTSSLPEVGGDAVLSCDPLDVVAISGLMERICEDEDLRRSLARKGKDRLTAYSWQASTAELVAACNRLMERNPVPTYEPAAGLAALTGQIEELEADRAIRLEMIHRLEAQPGRLVLKKLVRTIIGDVPPRDAVKRLLGWPRRALSSMVSPWRRLVSRWKHAPSRFGVWRDNWLGPRSELPLRTGQAEKQFYLSGTVPVDMKLTVEAGKKPLGSFSLKAGSPQKIVFQVNDVQPDPLVLRFSDYIIDPSNRRLAFRLQDTNLFTEDDLGWSWKEAEETGPKENSSEASDSPAAILPIPRLSRLEWRLRRSKLLAWGIDRFIHQPRRFWHARRWQQRQSPTSLSQFEWKQYSQFGEDGIIREVFRRIGPGDRFAIEFGIGDGSECCTRNLLANEGWRGLLMEGSASEARQAAKLYGQHPQVKVANQFITVETINDLFASYGVPKEPDLLVIDIDGNDYWIWKRILEAYRPRVIIIEYNARWVPPVEWVMPYNPNHHWTRTASFGASLTSLAELGSQNGYTLVGCTSTGVNAFFVRNDQLGDSFADCDKPVEYHYAPPLYGRGFGHPIRRSEAA